MADTSDPELILNEHGDLQSLYKRDLSTGLESKFLLSAEQVAKCVKVSVLKKIMQDDLPAVCAEPYDGEVKGLKVNLIGGATGAGKTSMINIMAGGMETSPKQQSDTKCPAIYIFTLDGDKSGAKYALLDTAGLCDTAATAQENVGMQELLINAVAATVKLYELEVVSFLMCVDMIGRMPPHFGDVWPQMQMSLGGNALEKMCTFVITKANGGSKVDDAKLRKLPDTEFYKELEHSPLGWKVTHAGRENLGGVREILKPVSSSEQGIGASSVDPNAESLATKEMLAREMEQNLKQLRESIQKEKLTDTEFQNSIDLMQRQIHSVCLQLKDVDWCDDAEKNRLLALIDEKYLELERIKDARKKGEASMEQSKERMREWEKDLEKQMEEIKKMHGIGAFFRKLVGGVVRRTVAEVTSRL